MRYLLIDNCTLLHLVQEDGYNNYLSELENLINNEEVGLIVHKIINEEWEKHKLKRKNRLERKLLNYKNEEISNSTSPGPIIPIVNIDHIGKQILQIDKLLTTAITVETYEGIRNEIGNRIKNKLAPFHKKTDSVNDWEIIGSVCNYCEIYGIKELYFMSHNYTDFADETDINRKIHTDIQSRFNKVNIYYFKNYSDFFDVFSSSLPANLISYQIIKSEKYSHKTTIKKTDLDSLYYLYSELYNEINFIPIHILRKLYPFSKSETSHVYYGIFTFHYVNESLITFFENVIIKENKKIEFRDESLVSNILNYKHKIEYVLRHLTQNLIFNLSGEIAHKRIDIHYYNPKKNCECFICTYNRFEFHKTFKEINSESSDVKEKLKIAYIHYQLGNYISANKLYNEIIEVSITEEKFLIYFIAKYNQRHLGNFLRNFFFNKSVDNNLVDQLLSIDPLEEAVKLKSHTDYTFLSFIASQDFFSDAYEEIREQVDKILDHYYSQLNGGWSSNQHVWNLITEFVSLEAFINSNYIIYDNYSNFEKLFEMVTQGLLASHAISEKQDSRLTHFDDYWVGKFIVYGKKETIIKYFNRYKLESLKYKPSSIENDTFIDLIENLLNNEQSMINSAKEFADGNNQYFSNKYNHLFENVFVMASLLELNENDITHCADLLISFLKTQTLLIRPSFDSIKLFINKKGKKFNEKILFKLINHFIADPNHSNVLEALIDHLNKKNIKKLLPVHFDNILENTLEIKDNRQIFPPELIIKIFELSDNIRKQRISNSLQAKLDEKFRFDSYYLFAINGVIELKKSRLIEWIALLDLDSKTHSYQSIFGNEDYQSDYLDQLLNLCFKYNFNTQEKEFKKLKKVHPYYEWLIDMENYDYSKFDPEWVLNYQTTYYWKQMSKSANLKQALISFLKDNFNSRIERLLLRITYFASD